VWDLLESYRPYLSLLLCLQSTRTSQLLERSDAIQEVFLKAAGHLGQFRGGSEQELMAWLRRILATTLVSQDRNRSPVAIASFALALDHSSQVLDRHLIGRGQHAQPPGCTSQAGGSAGQSPRAARGLGGHGSRTGRSLAAAGWRADQCSGSAPLGSWPQLLGQMPGTARSHSVISRVSRFEVLLKRVETNLIKCEPVRR
jgi:hypothetical protein